MKTGLFYNKNIEFRIRYKNKKLDGVIFYIKIIICIMKWLRVKINYYYKELVFIPNLIYMVIL